MWGAVAVPVAVAALVLLLAITIWRPSSEPGLTPAVVEQVGGTEQEVAASPRNAIQDAETRDEFSPAQLYKRVAPSVVRVDKYDRNGRLAGFGSGFLISPDGQVVTNLHVIRGAATVSVHLNDSRKIDVRSVLGINTACDLALLDIGGSGYNCLQLSTETPEIGTRVYAIGNPEGLASTLSEGIVSGWPQLDDVLYVQTTAAISAGSSGGPLLLADGAVIGITTASLRGGQSLNLAIPASEISKLLHGKQSPLSLAEVNAEVGGEQHHQATIEDDPAKLAAVWEAIQANRLGDALKLLEQVPNTRRGGGFWIVSGHLQFKLRNVGAAQVAFSKAVGIDPDNTEALLRLALSLRFDDPRKADWDTARTLCDRVIQIDATNVPAYIIRGISTIGDSESAGFYKSAAALDPHDFGAQYNLGLALLGNRDSSKEAARALEAATELEKEVDWDDYLTHQDGVMGGLWKLTKLPTAKSLHIPIKLALASAYRDAGQYELAIQLYEEVLAIEPNNPVTPWGLCFSYRGWHKDHKHPDALHWEREAGGTDFMPAASTSLYMPRFVYNYFGMLE